MSLIFLLLASTGLASHDDQGPSSCTHEDCEADEAFLPDLVSGHTVYARWVVTQEVPWNEEIPPLQDRLPTPPSIDPPDVPDPNEDDAIALAQDVDEWLVFGRRADEFMERGTLTQAECIGWSNGYNLEHRPFDGPDDPNAFPSDEDALATQYGPTEYDLALQDWDLDREIRDCVPNAAASANDPYFGVPTDFAALSGYHLRAVNRTGTPPPGVEDDSGPRPGSFAVAVERGDCAPTDGVDFRFRGHLDFVDPNHIYHEVQEYEYECRSADRNTPVGNQVPPLVLDESVSDHVQYLFPNTYTDPHNVDGCAAYDDPRTTMDPSEGDPGFFDLGHKCNGSIRDLFTERMWITAFHEPIFDPTLLVEYNFALQVDTCAGLNIHERDLVPLLDGRELILADRLGARLDLAHESRGDVCFDGSSFSFDDRARTWLRHAAPPTGPGSQGVWAGNAYDFDPTAMTFGTHRTNCQLASLWWPLHPFHEQDADPWSYSDCYQEAHRLAQVDLYVYDMDPTGGHWQQHTNGSTGPSDYLGPGKGTSAAG